MIRGVLFSVALSALLIYAVYRMVDLYEAAMPERVTRVDIYAEHITYRTSEYPSTSLFAVGLKAAHDPPKYLGLHDCTRMDTLGTVVEILRAEGYTSFEIELPDGC
jgi:hypothetical protein